MITSLAGVLVYTAADRWAAMDRFYVEVLGLTPRTRRDGFVNFELGHQRITVTVHDRVHGASTEPNRLMLNLEVDDIVASHAQLVAAGVAFTRAPEQEPWGGWIATLADPDGNTVQLFQLPR